MDHFGLHKRVPGMRRAGLLRLGDALLTSKRCQSRQLMGLEFSKKKGGMLNRMLVKVKSGKAFFPAVKIDLFSPGKRDTHLRELLTGSSIAFGMKIAGALLGYVFTLLIARNFGAVAMGVFALSLTVLNVFSILGRLGLDTALLRFIAEYLARDRKDLAREVYKKSLRVIVPFSLCLTGLLFLLAPYIAKYVFHKEYLSLYFRIMSLAIMPAVLTLINSQTFRAIKKIVAFSFFQNVSISLFASLFLISMLVFGHANTVPVIAYVLAVATGALLSHILLKKHADLKTVPASNEIRFKTVLDVSLPMLFTSSVSFLLHWVDTLMLGMFRGEAEVGVFNIAVKIAMFTGVTLIAINSIAAPKFAEFYGKNDIEGLGRIARQSTKLIFWTSFPIFCVVLLFPSLILGIFGEEFKSGVAALYLLAAGQFVSAISGSVAIILNMLMVRLSPDQHPELLDLIQYGWEILCSPIGL